MNTGTKYGLLLAAALTFAIAVAGCGTGGGISGGGGPPVETITASLEGAGTAPDYTADPGDIVTVLAQVPSDATSVQATIQAPSGGPLPPQGGTLTLILGPWTPPANYGRGFTVPSDAPTGTVYVIQVTAQTPRGTIQSDLLTLTVKGGAPPCLPVSAWFSGRTQDVRSITVAAGTQVTVLARPFGTVTAVRATIQGTPVPPEGATITLSTGSFPSPATHGGSFTVPATATSGTVYVVTVAADFGSPSSCTGTSTPLTVTVQ